MPLTQLIGDFNPILLKGAHQVQVSSFGIVTVFVFDWCQMALGRAIDLKWQFSFIPEPGDILAQVKERLRT